MTSARRAESQEQILEAAVASLTEADIPPDEQDGWPDPDADPPAEQVVAAEMLVAELGDHFISVRCVAQHGCDAKRLVLPETAGIASVA